VALQKSVDYLLFCVKINFNLCEYIRYYHLVSVGRHCNHHLLNIWAAVKYRISFVVLLFLYAQNCTKHYHSLIWEVCDMAFAQHIQIT